MSSAASGALRMLETKLLTNHLNSRAIDELHVTVTQQSPLLAGPPLVAERDDVTILLVAKGTSQPLKGCSKHLLLCEKIFHSAINIHASRQSSTLHYMRKSCPTTEPSGIFIAFKSK